MAQLLATKKDGTRVYQAKGCIVRVETLGTGMDYLSNRQRAEFSAERAARHLGIVGPSHVSLNELKHR